MKKRLDQVLAEKGLFESRTKAQAAILAGTILVNEQKIDKSGTLVDEDSEIRILGEKMKYVSRGGLKLEKALDDFKADPSGKICIDIGASTGGFTDCLLQKGAAKVYAVDVGYGQMHLKVRNDKRVVVIERNNARYLTPEVLYGIDFETGNFASFFVMDVSFISILKILPALYKLLSENGEVVSLIKPQFEVGRKSVSKGGIVRDKKAVKEMLENIKREAENSGFKVMGTIESPITGADGNVEYFIHLKKNNTALS
ncbi:MAG: TlyA family RNA methyltransferase [Candidatus Saganbacteria bacterium]|nr:TlyA family RNA methyltransferase [Candidatus Saganbacteria bacterium]